MDKDLIIGGAYNYTWNELKYWVNSIRSTRFDGDVVLVTDGIDYDTMKILKTKGVSVWIHPQVPGAPHVERFSHIQDYLKDNSEKYRFVTVTDTRDVIFQRSPTKFLESCSYSNRTMVCSSEGMLYKDEPWGKDNIVYALGSASERLMNRLIYNVGTIAGKASSISDFLLVLYEISKGKGIVDQAMFNLLVSCEPYIDKFFYTNNDDYWAIQLGTTEAAITSGYGDIGLLYKQGKYSIDEYRRVYRDIQPIIRDDEVLVPGLLEERYTIVHQWDRVDGLRDSIRRKYGD